MKQERFNPGLGDYSPPSRRHCEHCQQDRIFQNYKCLTCGTVRDHIPIPNARIYTWAQRLRRSKIYRQRSNDRADYYKRQAEESRAKFEGKK